MSALACLAFAFMFKGRLLKLAIDAGIRRVLSLSRVFLNPVICIEFIDARYLISWCKF